MESLTSSHGASSHETRSCSAPAHDSPRTDDQQSPKRSAGAVTDSMAGGGFVANPQAVQTLTTSSRQLSPEALPADL